MDKIDLNKMTKNKLIKQLSDSKESLLNLKFQQKLQQLENPLSVRFVKREIAQKMYDEVYKASEKYPVS